MCAAPPRPAPPATALPATLPATLLAARSPRRPLPFITTTTPRAALPPHPTRALHYCRAPPGTLPARAPLTRPAARPAACADPTDCDFALAPANPDDVVNATVPRDSLEKVAKGGWSPKTQGYVGNENMSGGGAFGAQYVFAHSQIDHYPTS